MMAPTRANVYAAVPDEDEFQVLHNELVQAYEHRLDRHRQEAQWLADRSEPRSRVGAASRRLLRLLAAPAAAGRRITLTVVETLPLRSPCWPGPVR